MRQHRAGRVARMFVVLAGIHSLLAAGPVKYGIARLIGWRYRNGLYRLLYCVQSAILWGGGTIWFLRQPDQVLYRVRRPWSWLLGLVQALWLLLLWRNVRVIGLIDFFGLSRLATLLRGAVPSPEPEAQGPPLRADGTLKIEGPFRYTRHMDNLPIALLWLFPTMTVNRLTVALLGTAYAIVGSIHEEIRLRVAYGHQYVRYQQRVPFMIPRVTPVEPGHVPGGDHEKTASS